MSVKMNELEKQSRIKLARVCVFDAKQSKRNSKKKKKNKKINLARTGCNDGKTMSKGQAHRQTVSMKTGWKERAQQRCGKIHTKGRKTENKRDTM